MNKTQIEKKSGYHHGDLRAQLVAATRRLVESKGPDHFSVAEACREAGVSTAAPYKHFRDKDDMIRAVVFEGMDRHRDQMLAAIAPLDPSSPERITALGRVYLDFACAEPGVFRLMFALSQRHSDDPELIAHGNSLFGVVIDQVAHCLGRSEPVAEDIRRAFMLWSFVHGMSFLLIDGKVSKLSIEMDREAILSDITRRVLPECFAPD